MSTRNRVLAGIFLVFAIGVAYLLNGIIKDLEPRYLESAEEPLVDISRILAAVLATDMRNGTIDAGRLRTTFSEVYRQHFLTKIYALEKTTVDMSVYVTDRDGIVIFDSMRQEEGADFSRWRDVKLTLQGVYGARTTRADPGDPSSSVMFVAAPITWGGEIVGVLTVGKPTRNLNTFVNLAQHKIITAGITSVVALTVVALFAAVWLTRPIELWRDSVRLARSAPRMALPRLRLRAAGVFGAAYKEMRDTLAGRNYVEEYVQALTHEIKSPLSAIRGAAELLTEDMPATRRNLFVGNIRAETERIQIIIDKLLELSALEQRHGLTDVQDVAVDALMADTAEATAAATARHGVTVEVAPGADITISGDRFLLQRALENLLLNAIDFSPPGGTIGLQAEINKYECLISVTDAGPGIPEYARLKVLERFYSLPRPGSGSGRKSTGLGLSFVKEIIELHHGSITLTNLPEGGFRATLKLPLTFA